MGHAREGWAQLGKAEQGRAGHGRGGLGRQSQQSGADTAGQVLGSAGGPWDVAEQKELVKGGAESRVQRGEIREIKKVSVTSLDATCLESPQQQQT